jgi:hypothetical protein
MRVELRLGLTLLALFGLILSQPVASILIEANYLFKYQQHKRLVFLSVLTLDSLESHQL